LWYYKINPDKDFRTYGSKLGLDFVWPYQFNCADELDSKFPPEIIRGLTATCSGFYAPQGRMLRMPITEPDFIAKLSSIDFDGQKVTNFEMETAAIFGLSKLFGFNALAVNAIVANRITHEFSHDPHKTIDATIKLVLESVCK
jgi:uridine phosphorylase